MNIPNILTVFRLIAAPMVGLVYVFLPTPYADWIALSLFVSASLTDYLDGYLARKWGQITNFGRMLDPIADKAMVLIALLVIVHLSQRDILILIPVIFIIFREVFVSGLREFLGTRAGMLQVTQLAKWKTMSQMVAITVILASYLFSYYAWAYTYGMDVETFNGIMSGEFDDKFGLRWILPGLQYSTHIGTALLWAAGILTLITGFDYFRKALPMLKED